MDQFIIKECDGFQTIEMNWTSNRTGFKVDTFEEATQAIRDADINPAIACTAFFGVPRCFCLGTDANSFAETGNLNVLSDVVLRFFRALINSKKPLLAGVDGPAIGLGMTMLLHFDAVFATPASVFRAPFSDWGLSPEAGSSLLMPECIGYRRAFELFCLGGQLSADEAEQRGLVTRVIEADALNGTVIQAAQRLAALPQRPLRATRELMRHGRDRVIRQTKIENALFQELLGDKATQRRLKVMARAARIALSDGGNRDAAQGTATAAAQYTAGLAIHGRALDVPRL